MAIFVLGTQCLLDIAKKDGNKAQQWYDALAGRGVHFGDVCISAFSVAVVRFFFDDNPPSTPADRQLKTNVNHLIDLFKTAGAVIGCSTEAIYYWADNLGNGVQYDQPPPAKDIGVETLLLATLTVAHPSTQYTLVDRRQAVHQQLNITVHDPY
jgi:hypothetical protein